MSEQKSAVARRLRTPRLDVVTVLALVLPLLTVGLLALVRAQAHTDEQYPPTLTRLTSATVVCPAGLPGEPRVSVASASGRSGGSVEAGSQRLEPVARPGDGVTVVRSAGPLVVRGHDAQAPGLVAGRFGPGAALDCPQPEPDLWFTGLGARADHDSVISLVNPDSGPAIADLTLLSRHHDVVVERLRGITVPGHRTVEVDLGKAVPRRPELGVHVVVSRGRLGIAVRDTVTDLVTKRSTSDWVPPQAAPATDNLLLGLAPGTGTRTLAVANGGEDVVQASVRVVTGDTVFAPKGLKDLQVPPGTTQLLDVGPALTRALADRKDPAVGLEVVAREPLTATLTTQVGTDRSFTVPVTDVTSLASVALPGRGPASRVVVSADAAGVVRVQTWSASGGTLADKRVEVEKGRTVTVALPANAAAVRVTPSRTTIRGSVVVPGARGGGSVVPLRELVTHGLVPQVRPGLPLLAQSSGR